MRRESLSVFKQIIFPYLQMRQLDSIRIAILGGSLQDPEISLLSEDFILERVEFLGIDSANIGDCAFQYLDFNEVATKRSALNIDLAICTGVVEHLWNLDGMFKNFQMLVPDSALLWVSFPVSQIPHGSPEWYSSGYNPEMISKLAELNGFTCLDSGHLGNRRNYLFRHLLHLWPEKGDQVWFAFRWPIFSYLPTPGSISKKLFHQFLTIPHRLILQFASKQTENKLMTSTAGWVLLEKNKL